MLVRLLTYDQYLGLSEEERKQMLGVTNDKNNSNGENGSSALSEDWEKEIQEELEVCFNVVV